MTWKLAEAKNKFSEVVKLALIEGPQKVSRRDDSVYVVSEKEYEKLTGKLPGFKELLMSTPMIDDLDLSRDKSAMRDIELP
jgi:antitoxin Phd